MCNRASEWRTIMSNTIAPDLDVLNVDQLVADRQFWDDYKEKCEAENKDPGNAAETVAALDKLIDDDWEYKYTKVTDKDGKILDWIPSDNWS